MQDKLNKLRVITDGEYQLSKEVKHLFFWKRRFLRVGFLLRQMMMKRNSSSHLLNAHTESQSNLCAKLITLQSSTEYSDSLMGSLSCV